MPTTDAPRHPIEGTPEKTRVAVGCGVGACIETYDFIGYGTAAALYFGDAFFPDSDPLSARCSRSRRSGIGLRGAAARRHPRRLSRRSVRAQAGARRLAAADGHRDSADRLLPTYATVGVLAPSSSSRSASSRASPSAPSGAARSS